MHMVCLIFFYIIIQFHIIIFTIFNARSCQKYNFLQISVAFFNFALAVTYVSLVASSLLLNIFDSGSLVLVYHNTENSPNNNFTSGTTVVLNKNSLFRKNSIENDNKLTCKRKVYPKNYIYSLRKYSA